MTTHLLKHLDLYLITVDEHFDCHLLHTILDAFEDLHKQQQLSCKVLKNMACELCATLNN